jgi:hypothetical protein
LADVLKNKNDQELVRAAFELLRDSIRNRDLHSFALNVRAANFPAVERLLIPALNILMRSLDSEKLRHLQVG